MIYNLALSDKRKFQWANELQIPAPIIHATRNLDVHDFIYILKGEWSLSVEKETYKLKEDDVILLPAGMTHGGVGLCTPNTEIIYLHVYPMEDDGVTTSFTDSGDIVTINNLINAQDRPIIKTLFQRLAHSVSDRALFLAYVNVLFKELSIASTNSTTTLAGGIRDFLLKTKKTPSNTEVAQHFHISKRTAETLFRKAFGKPMHQYAMEHKLERAKQYLIDFPETSLCEIAQFLNFCDEHHLSHSFKKAFGVSPQEYKKDSLQKK